MDYKQKALEIVDGVSDFELIEDAIERALLEAHRNGLLEAAEQDEQIGKLYMQSEHDAGKLNFLNLQSSATMHRQAAEKVKL